MEPKPTKHLAVTRIILEHCLVASERSRCEFKGIIETSIMESSINIRHHEALKPRNHS